MLRNDIAMRSHTICRRFCTAIIAISLSCSWTLGQSTIKSQQQSENKNAPKYRIARKYRIEKPYPMLVLQISIEPKYFNPTDLLALAQRLNKDFRNEEQLTVVICDDYRAYRIHSLIFDIGTEGRSRGLRGVYGIDRIKSKEGISFSSERGKSISEIDIDLSKEP